MSEENTVRNILKKAAYEQSEIAGGQRVRRGGQGAELVAAFLTEVDETQLARRITLRTGPRGVLSFEAANRRLIRVLPPIPAQLAGFDEVFGTALDAGDGETLSRLYDLISAFLGRSTTFEVESAKPDPGAKSGQIGISAATLARAWDVAFQDRGGADPETRFDAAIGDIAASALVWAQFQNGALVEHGGDGFDPDWARHCLCVDWLDLLGVEGRPGVPAAAEFCSARDGQQLWVAAMDGWVFCALMPKDVSAAEIWQREF